MNTSRTILLAVAVLTLGLFVAYQLPHRSPPAGRPTAPKADSVAVNQDTVDVFRRAFWRQPGAGDRIVHAERRETSDSNRDVTRWQWFIEVRASDELLAALRDPAGFGLMPTKKSAGPTGSAPAWFPQAETKTDFEVLRASSGGLTVFYRASDRTLFATDEGGGFAPPVTAVARR